MAVSQATGGGDQKRQAEDNGKTAVKAGMPSPGQPPQPRASINTLLRQHSNERLYVKPLLWTARHLEILGCRFLSGDGRRHPLRPFTYSYLPLSPPASPADNPQDGTSDNRSSDHSSSGHGSSGDNEVAGLDPENCSHKRKRCGTRYVMSAFRDPCLHWRRDATVRLLNWGLLRTMSFNAILDFDFNGKPVASVQPVTIFGSRRPLCLVKPHYKRESFDAPVEIPRYPLVLWLDYQAFAVEPRQARCNPVRDNEPVRALREIELRRLAPSEQKHDPYLAAALISLAQDQHRWETEYGPRLGRRVDRSHLFTTRLVVAGLTSEDMWHVYTADIPLSFLDKLDRPSVASDAPTVDIIYHQVKARPYHSFRDRLLEGLGLSNNKKVGEQPKQQGIERKMWEWEEDDSSSDSSGWDSGECDSPEGSEDENSSSGSSDSSGSPDWVSVDCDSSEDSEDEDCKKGGLKKDVLEKRGVKRKRSEARQQNSEKEDDSPEENPKKKAKKAME